MDWHPMFMLLGKPSFSLLSANVTLALWRQRVKQSNSSSLTSSVWPWSSAIVITVTGSQFSSKTGNGVTIFDNRSFVVFMLHFFISWSSNGCWLCLNPSRSGVLRPGDRSTTQNPQKCANRPTGIPNSGWRAAAAIELIRRLPTTTDIFGNVWVEPSLRIKNVAFAN